MIVEAKNVKFGMEMELEHAYKFYINCHLEVNL
jgi:hypothetical protein